MVCNQWEEKGLLFTADELDDAEAAKYRKHLETCEFCRLELGTYKRQKATLFTPAMLEQAPPVAVDEEILRVCTKPVKPAATTFIMPAFIKNTLYALLVLAVGFSGGTYYMGIRIASKAKKQESNVVKNEQIPRESEAAVTTGDVGSGQEQVPDSLKSKDTLFKRENEIPAKGIIPVELHEDE